MTTVVFASDNIRYVKQVLGIDFGQSWEDKKRFASQQSAFLSIYHAD